jgi:hypothetical protein
MTKGQETRLSNLLQKITEQPLAHRDAKDFKRLLARKNLKLKAGKASKG